MRVLQTVASIFNESAGPSYTVPSLCKGLVRNGVEVELHILDKDPMGKREFTVREYPRRSIPAWALGRSPEMLRGMIQAAGECDVIHNNGIWMMPNVYAAIAKRNSNSHLVFCPRGGLSAVAMKRSRIKKFIMGHILGQYGALRATDMFHAASMKELEEIRAFGCNQPVALVPNGVDIPETTHRPFADHNRKIAFFGRIHTTKAVDHLVAAWGNVADKFPEWSLDIAGPDCGAVPMLKAMIAERQIPRITFAGEKHGSEKYDFLSSADLYVLPSLTENFGITIAEALACGTPVIASRGCPWERLGEMGCGWWIDIGVEALTAQLESTLACPPETLEAMGRRGRRWMALEYSWDGVAKKMVAAYNWLCHGDGKPAFVYM